MDFHIIDVVNRRSKHAVTEGRENCLPRFFSAAGLTKGTKALFKSECEQRMNNACEFRFHILKRK